MIKENIPSYSKFKVGEIISIARDLHCN